MSPHAPRPAAPHAGGFAAPAAPPAESAESAEPPAGGSDIINRVAVFINIACILNTL